jgi:hypothetical protein
LLHSSHCKQDPVYVFLDINCGALFPISTFMYLRAIYILPWIDSKIGAKSRWTDRGTA